MRRILDKIKIIKDWKKQFQGVSNLHRFPLDLPGENLSKEGISSLEFEINQELYSRLGDFCQENDCSLFSVFFTAWSILFSRYTGQNESVIGLYRPQIRGLTNDVIPILSHLESHESFLSVLKKNVEFFKTTNYQLVNASEVFETLKIDPTQNHHPLYQTQFSFYDNNASNIIPVHTINLKPGSSLSSIPLDLELRIFCSSDECSLSVYYSSDILNSSTIKNILSCYERLLESILETPNAEISSLDILPSAERNKILIDWNDTAWEYPQDKTIHQLFEEQVEKTPDTIAVVYEQQQLTYLELNERSNQLAGYLRAQGVGPETIVAIACERSLEMIIGIMGILKAGGAYVPMDPAYPRERLEYILKDTKVSVVLTQSWVREKLPEMGRQVIELDYIDEFVEGYPVGNLEALSGPHNLAYVIYTSGSTGKPKGVMIENKSLVNYALWCENAYPDVDKKGSVVHSPIVFDMSITSIFYPLISGNFVRIIAQKYDPESLIEAFKQENFFSFVKMTPSHLKLISGNSSLVLKGEAKFLIFGGEELKGDDILFWQKYRKKTVLFNQYGPTEATVACTIYEIPENNNMLKSIPIGKPIWNTSLYILDDTLHPVPIGVIGELYIGGDCLARGYLNRPDLTAERFIPNPFMTEEDRIQNHNTRLYRTGDLCRYLEDGNIQYIGRIDHQVKIRGFRIELGEIEATLLSNPAIKEVVVMAREDEPDSKRLVAYYVVTPGAAIEPSALRDYLKSSLPDYMIPSFFVPLEAMPLAPNGKLDRHALPTPEGSEIRREYVAPRTPTEEALVEIWQDILRFDRIGVNDNFFEMGGDSLKSIRVISRIKQQNSIEIPYRYFFENPIISELSNYIDNNIIDKSILPLLPVPRDQSIPLSFNQLPLLLEGIYVTNLIHVVHFEGYLNYSAFEEVLNEIIHRHEALRSAVILSENSQDLPIQTVEQELSININCIDLTPFSEADQQIKIKNFIDSDAKKPFDLSIAPLCRFHLIKKNENDHLFIFTIHHMFYDLESRGILFNEISKLYNAKVLGTQPKLPALPIQWVDYSVWQWDYLKGPKYEEYLSYWKENLKNPPIELELPIDYPRKAKTVREIISYLRRLELISRYTRYFLNRDVISRLFLMQYYESAQHSFEIPKILSKSLKKLSEEQNVTLYMTLLAALNVLIYGYSSQEDIIIGSPFSNRNRVETEGLIGCFVNFLPMRTNLKGNPTFNQLLQRVKTITLNAYDYQYVPWVQLFEHYRKQEDSILLNVGRLMFSLEQNLSNNLSLEGIISTKEAYEDSFSECELILIIEEKGGDLSGCLKYRKNLFKKETIEEMSKRFLIVLESIINNPEIDINQLSSISQEENKLRFI